MSNRARLAKYLRNTVFGIEDSLVSTVGLLSGVAVVGTDVKTIILAGVVLIFVEAFSMGMGSLLSDHSAAEFEERREVKIRKSVTPSIIMFVSYFVAGFIPLAPYLLLAAPIALPVSILLALAALFILGAVSAKISGTKVLQHGLEMLILGGVAIGLGVIVGLLVNSI